MIALEGFGVVSPYDITLRWDHFTAVPSTFIDGGDHVVVIGRYGGTMKNGRAMLDAPFCHVYRCHGGRAVMFQQYTDTAQWTRLMA